MPSTTSFDGVNLHYTCPYCGYTRSESADPAKNLLPLTYLGGRCSSCQHPVELDWAVVEQAQATFSKKPDAT
ncbi:MAG: hypothetical protein COX55_03590 [Zetaproteobacteria bacterium CG23_combo_of_CG06-09_8_20_14_all_54_7]|nr:MAG: hypothetical protein COX55_03590 [Zetaproteobacteria bacterium CG23_combo_of_CG06-09_8_20_14_all_54_7]